jgi:hypothetical protein
MENIIEPNESFDFSQLTLAHPTGIQGGAYFTKIEFNKKPLYIQTLKSVTRQGFIKSGKKYYCDLMFDKEAEVLINWFENLEDRCQKLIFEKSDTWFQNNLEQNDIESAFNSIIRIYKSGKFYLVRVNVKNNISNLPAIKIYDENENALTMEDISSETNIISILEIQGIKFTSRNFQIEIEIKQVMAVKNEPLFNNCLIKTNKTNQINIINSTIPQSLDKLNLTIKTNKNLKLDENNNLNNDLNFINNDINNDNDIDNDNDNDIDNIDNGKDSLNIITEIPILEETKDNLLEEFTPIDVLERENNNDLELDLEIEDLNEIIKDDPNDLKEFNLDVNLENNLEKINLKKPNQVYFELYKEARNKAKIAKRNAILAYLEAKNIKKTYLIENLNDSDSDFDAEIDEVSESELEGL